MEERDNDILEMGELSVGKESRISGELTEELIGFWKTLWGFRSPHSVLGKDRLSKDMVRLSREKSTSVALPIPAYVKWQLPEAKAQPGTPDPDLDCFGFTLHSSESHHLFLTNQLHFKLISHLDQYHRGRFIGRHSLPNIVPVAQSKHKARHKAC